MIKSISVTNYRGETKKMILAEPEESGLAIIGADGLGPGNAQINMTDLATVDGAAYNSARIPKRSITLDMKFMFHPTIEDARQETYRFFPLKKPVVLTVETDNRVCSINGYTESNEPDIFSNFEGTSITIVCPFPFFSKAGDEAVSTTDLGADSMFSFPFCGESVENPTIQFREIAQGIESRIIYDGDVDTGAIFRMSFTGAVRGISLYNVLTNEHMDIDDAKLAALLGGQGIQAGDQIEISTVVGNKYIRLLRNGVWTNILNCLAWDTPWFIIEPGLNVYSYVVDEGATDISISVEIVALYEGV